MGIDVRAAPSKAFIETLRRWLTELEHLEATGAATPESCEMLVELHELLDRLYTMMLDVLARPCSDVASVAARAHKRPSISAALEMHRRFGSDLDARGLGVASASVRSTNWQLRRIVAQLPHLWRIFVASHSTAMAMETVEARRVWPIPILVHLPETNGATPVAPSGVSERKPKGFTAERPPIYWPSA